MSLALNRVDTTGPAIKYIYVQVQNLDPPAPKAAAEGKKRRAPEASAEAGPSKTPRAQHPLALVGKLLQQLKKDTLQNILRGSGRARLRQQGRADRSHRRRDVASRVPSAAGPKPSEPECVSVWCVLVIM
eukprot:7011532-Prymnesium_polylepis.1